MVRKKLPNKETIGIHNSQKRVPISTAKYRNRARFILKLLSKTKKHRLTSKTEVNFIFVDDRQIKKWHGQYLGDPTPTDVISFSMREGKSIQVGVDQLGDIVVSVQTAKRQARLYQKNLEEEITLYMIHGLLHLLGYDDLTLKKKKVMDRLQFSLLDEVMQREKKR